MLILLLVAIAAANARADAAQSAPNSNRFENEADAITYAQNSGQGALRVSSSGAITNQYGETMVYDSSGNLAPAPRMTPVEDTAGTYHDPVAAALKVANAAIADAQSASYSSRFENEADAITYAQNSGQGDLKVSVQWCNH